MALVRTLIEKMLYDLACQHAIDAEAAIRAATATMS